jgi:hypothetical protein
MPRPTRRILQRQQAFDHALDLITTARTDPGTGALVDHTARVYAELHRPTDPTGSAARIGRLITTLAFCAGHALEQWLATDPASPTRSRSS